MKEEKIKNALRITLILIGLVFLFNMMYRFYVSITESQGVSRTLPEEYRHLFLKTYQSKFREPFTFNSKVRYPVSYFDIDNQYSLVVFKLTLSDNLSLSEVIKEHRHASSFTQGAVYLSLNQLNYRLKEKSGGQSLISNLHLTLNGNSIKTIVKNDSVASYYLKFKDFSLKYGLDDDVHIYAEYGTREFSSVNPVPINLLFLKRNKFVYFIILSANDLNVPLHENTLFKLMKF